MSANVMSVATQTQRHAPGVGAATLSLMSDNKILLFHTKCQLRCKYCHFSFEQTGFNGYDKFHECGKSLTAREMLDGLEQFRPYHIEFTGGEPLLWSGFRDFVHWMPSDCRWAITSNTILDVSGLDVSKCISWTASHHGFDEERFCTNVRYLRNIVQTSISFVIPFAEVKTTLIKANKTRLSTGVRVNLLRELNKSVSWENTEQLSLLRSMPSGFFNVVEDDIPMSYEFESGFSCHGGADYVCVFTDGQVFNCYSDAMVGDSAGDIRSFKKRDGVFDCYAKCLGCALDHKARMKKL